MNAKNFNIVTIILNVLCVCYWIILFWLFRHNKILLFAMTSITLLCFGIYYINKQLSAVTNNNSKQLMIISIANFIFQTIIFVAVVLDWYINIPIGSG